MKNRVNTPWFGIKSDEFENFEDECLIFVDELSNWSTILRKTNMTLLVLGIIVCSLAILQGILQKENHNYGDF